MRLTSFLTLALVAAALPACASGASETSNETTGTPATTGTPGTSTSATTGDPTTGPVTTGNTTGTPGTTGEPATTTGEPATSTTTGEPLTTTAGGTTGGPGSSSGTDTTGEPLAACVSDKDCALHDDCCDCYGVPNGQVDPSCALRCDQSMCSQLGIDQAVCRFGVCITEKLDCDGSNVICKALPPNCAKGQLPGVQDGCWTGSCVPVRNCNAVPDCTLCPEGEMCVQKVSKQQTWPVCEPIPSDCGGEIDCGCAGAAVCIAPFDACNDQDGNQLSCGCPVC